MGNKQYSFEKVDELTKSDNIVTIKLDPLDEIEKHTINPLVPPTSGLRMEVFKIDKSGNAEKYVLSKKMLSHFLRVIKGIAVIAKKEVNKKNPAVLLVTDDRPSGNVLLEYASRIFAFENYKIYHQGREGERTKNSDYIRGKSKMSSPYASASVVLFNHTMKLDVVLMLTASHNSLEWNGLKFYIERPIPISGGVMKAVSSYALGLTEIELVKKYQTELIDADKINNDYIIKLVSKIVNLGVLKNKKVIVWPFLGTAPEILSLLESCGANIVLINDSRDPPDPTHGFDKQKLQDLMIKENVKISILLDADRDRLVFLIRIGEKFYELTPNELYTAMHNILAIKMNKKVINVRTIPSDPRGDGSASINFITGVGYKHLGLVQYLAAGMDVPQSQLETGVLYYEKNHSFIQLKNMHDIQNVFLEFGLEGELIFVLWEESGGHTFNILNAKKSNGKIELKSDVPLIGDKYPACAILVLCSLLEMGYDLTEFIDQTKMGENTTINASDEEKIKYMKFLDSRVGKNITIAGIEYKIGAFLDVSGNISDIYLISNTTKLYIRPSGTGPAIKIYVFGPRETYLTEMKNVAEFMKNLKI